jgi:ADP-ribose pyrophosphatase YjhB (NUDIX family)
MIVRKNTGWMDGYYGLPSGKVEWGETFSQAAIREALEEVGVGVGIAGLVPVHVAHRHSEDTDWVDVYFEVSTWTEPFNAEPEKSEKLEWIELSNLPDNVVPSIRQALLEIQNKNHYSEFGW